MHFEVHAQQKAVPNHALVYRAEEYSFDVEPTPSDPYTSLMIDNLNLELNSVGRIISVWGLCPFTRWRKSQLRLDNVQEYRDVFFIPDEPLVSGVSLRVGKDWPVLVDSGTGWVKIAGGCDGDRFAQILRNVILELDQHGGLCAVWLRPEQLPNLE